jgi:hypothetical protein
MGLNFGEPAGCSEQNQSLLGPLQELSAPADFDAIDPGGTLASEEHGGLALNPPCSPFFKGGISSL